MIKLFRTTKCHSTWWRNRKIDWKKSYLDTWNHPHRYMISQLLGKIPWISLLEVGCGPGPNLANIIINHKGKQVGGIDLNEDAIKLAKETFKGAFLKVGSVEDIMMSDNSSDVILTDMTLIYVGRINQAIKEIKRVARRYIILCELHSPSFYDRIKLKLESGYYAYDYKKLLTKYGFYDITLIKIPKEVWDSKHQISFGYIIMAKVPKEYN